MNELIDNLKHYITEYNKNIVESLINIISKNSLYNINSLIEFENENFKINGNVLSRIEKVEYCVNNILNSCYDVDAMDFEESLDYYEYYDLLKTAVSLDDKIKYIILMYDMTGREQLLVYELYNCIINQII